MDKRKNNGGNSTKTNGPDKRKNPYRDAISKACSEQDVIDVLKMLHKSAIEDKSTRAAKIYLEYTLGVPDKKIELKGVESLPIFNLNG